MNNNFQNMFPSPAQLNATLAGPTPRFEKSSSSSSLLSPVSRNHTPNLSPSMAHRQIQNTYLSVPQMLSRISSSSSLPDNYSSRATSNYGTAAAYALFQAYESSKPADLSSLQTVKYFLATAPSNWPANEHIKQFTLPTGDVISCIYWNNLFHITGTDIVKLCMYRFSEFGRIVKQVKKFEEGVFSDLRNLKPGVDATLEPPRSPFLEFLFTNSCIRTQKKQKVFYWFSVPHDQLFIDALSRDLKREASGLEPISISTVPMSHEKAMELARASCGPIVFDELASADRGMKRDNSSRSLLSDISPEFLSGSLPLPTLEEFDLNSMLDMPEMQIGLDMSNVIGTNNFSAGLEAPIHYSNNNSNVGDFNTMPIGLDFEEFHHNEEEKTYKCSEPTCKKVFKRLEHLRRHTRCHTEEKQFRCTYESCGREFARSDNLNAHLSQVHNVTLGPESQPHDYTNDFVELNATDATELSVAAYKAIMEGKGRRYTPYP